MTAFTPLTQQEKESHLNMFDTTGTSGILGSGEANYFDTNQLLNNDNAIDFTKNNVIYTGGSINAPDENINTSIISPTELNFSQVLSNGKVSRDYAINDFSIFNPYIHYQEFPDGFRIDTSKLLQKSVYKFNMYNAAFRQSPIQ